MSINDCNAKAAQRRTEYLNRQLSNGNNFHYCAHCDEQFYPMYSSQFCSKVCAQKAFETLCINCEVERLPSDAVLEMLCVCPDGVDAMDVRKIALLGHFKDLFRNKL